MSARVASRGGLIDHAHAHILAAEGSLKAAAGGPPFCLRHSRVLAHQCPASVALIRLARIPYSRPPEPPDTLCLLDLSGSRCSRPSILPPSSRRSPGSPYRTTWLALTPRATRKTAPHRPRHGPFRLSKPRLHERLRRIVPPAVLLGRAALPLSRLVFAAGPLRSAFPSVGHTDFAPVAAIKGSRQASCHAP